MRLYFEIVSLQAGLKRDHILRRVLRCSMVLRWCFRGCGYFCVANVTRDAWEEIIGNRGVLSQQFLGAGGREERQESEHRETSRENKIVRDPAA